MPAKAITTLTAAVRERILQFLPGVEFTAADVERITRELAPDYPPTGETMGSIRCMLQRLRPQGLLFVSAGRYVWPESELAAETASEARRLARAFISTRSRRPPRPRQKGEDIEQAARADHLGDRQKQVVVDQVEQREVAHHTGRPQGGNLSDPAVKREIAIDQPVTHAGERRGRNKVGHVLHDDAKHHEDRPDGDGGKHCVTCLPQLRVLRNRIERWIRPTARALADLRCRSSCIAGNGRRVPARRFCRRDGCIRLRPLVVDGEQGLDRFREPLQVLFERRRQRVEPW